MTCVRLFVSNCPAKVVQVVRILSLRIRSFFATLLNTIDLLAPESNRIRIGANLGRE